MECEGLMDGWKVEVNADIRCGVNADIVGGRLDGDDVGEVELDGLEEGGTPSSAPSLSFEGGIVGSLSGSKSRICDKNVSVNGLCMSTLYRSNRILKSRLPVASVDRRRWYNISCISVGRKEAPFGSERTPRVLWSVM